MATSPENPFPPASPALALVSVNDLSAAEASTAKLDEIFIEGGLEVPQLAAPVLLATCVEERLKAAETVEDAMPLVAEMAAAEKASKGVRVYPRSLLRIQHVAAFVIMNPFCSNTDIARFFHVGSDCIGNIMKTDTFKSLVSAHKVSIDHLHVDIQEQMRATMVAGLDVVNKTIVEKQDGDFALAAVDKIANRMGMGGRHQSAPTVQINNIITADMIAAARARRLPDGG